jgi:peroxiredoxin-like protein
VKDFPHQYAVTAIATSESDIDLSAPGLPTFRSAPPVEFDGPGDRWSPETLLVGAVADCFVLTFRAVARASRLPWTSLTCQAHGTLDRVERVLQFTRIRLHAHLTVQAGTSMEQAQRALERAEHNCLVSNSLKAAVVLETDVAEDEAVLC